MPLMAASTDTSTTLDLTSRAAEGSRSARRLRRTGQVPGVIYGGDGDAELFAVDGRILRNTLARSGAILQISVDGAAPGPVLVKDIQRHPVRGEAVHVDFLRVDMTQTIQTTIVLELVGNDSAPGVVEGGVLSQGAIELNIEALPGDIPDGIQFDVSGMEMNATATLAELTPPAGVILLDDPDETVLATITPPSQEPAEDEIETETEVVGEGEEPAEGEAPAEGGSGDESSDES
jgi:large subunit ribosomal protein L25